MLLSSESLLKVWCIESHELAESLKAKTVPDVLHSLFIRDNVIIKSFESWNLGHKKVTVTWCLDYRVVKQSQVIEGLNCCQVL